MLPHAAPDEALPARLPLPLAQLYRRAHNAKSAVERHIAAYYLWEAALKLLTSVAVVEYAERGGAAPDVADRLKNLARPAVGHWWELARLLVPALADAGDADYARLRDRLLGRPATDCPRAAGLDALLREVLENKSGARNTVQFTELFHRLVALRNDELGHGAAGQRPPAYYERSAPALLAGVAEALGRLDVLAGRSLVFVADVRRLASGEWLVERLNLSGGELWRLESLTVAEADAARLPRPGRLYLHGPDPASWRSLHPLVLFDADAEQVFFLNARVRKKRAEYLCYTSGQVVKRDELGQEQRELLARVLGGPVDEAAVEAWAERSSAGDPAPPPGAPAARTVGEFELLSILGRGGMGVVYRAWQPSLCRLVALKCLLRSGDPKSEARFAREIRALGRVEHPNLVKVFTSGADGDQWFYAMELLEGSDLAAVCAQFASSTASEVSEHDWTAAISTAHELQRKQETPLSAEPGTESAERKTEPAAPRSESRAPRSGRAHVARAVDVVRQAAEAAHALHEANVIHRDIKPGNILLTADGGHAVLMDLGLAQLADETEGRLTRTRQFVGTLRYASPEQQVGAALDRRADVYSLGATLWELLTLRPLFGITEQTPTPDMILKLQQAEPERVRRHNPRVPRDLESIVQKCLAKEKERRYATAAELSADLGRWQRGEPVVAQPPSLRYVLGKYARRYRTPLAIAAGVLLAAVVGIVIAFVQVNVAKNDAEQRRKDVEAANRELITKQNELEGVTARSWLLPLGMEPGPLRDTEIDVLSAVAANRDQRLTIRFIEEGTKEPRFTHRLGVRSEYAIHAAVGLDSQKRDAVEGLLVARLQADIVARESRSDLVRALTDLGDLSPSAVAVVAPILTQDIAKTKELTTLRALPEGLPPSPAIPDPGKWSQAEIAQLQGLVEGLSAVATRMMPQEAGKAAAALTKIMATETDPKALRVLAEGLSAVAARMEPKEGARVSAEAAARLTKSKDKETEFSPAMLAASVQLAELEAQAAPQEATALTQMMAKTTDRYILQAELAKCLSKVLADARPNKRAGAVAAAVGCLLDGNNLPGALVLLNPTVKLLPRQLTDQDLVELLKNPLCVGSARRCVLDELGVRHQRRFPDQWEFVRFAQEQKLGLDFTTPPKRR
jgi:serine/threonine protein kinase